MRRNSIKIVCLAALAQILGGCTLEAVHDGQYCPENLDGKYADDVYASPQKDNSQSIEIQNEKYCQGTYPICVNDICMRCVKDQVWVMFEGEDRYSCVSTDALEDCHTKSCEEVKDKINPGSCSPKCVDGILKSCSEGKEDVRCEHGCADNGRECRELTCSAGQIANGSECVCDEQHHWIDVDGNCVCDEANGYFQNGDACVKTTECDPVKEVESEDGSCSCNAEAHWVDVAGECVCDASNGFIEVDNACIEKAECDALKEVENPETGLCACNTEAHWAGTAGSCACDLLNGYEQSGDECVK